MSRMSEETAWPSDDTCDECGDPLDHTGICENTDRCVAAQEAEERFLAKISAQRDR